MRKSKNVFVCIGAVHYDYLLKLKSNITNFRTNPILQSRKIGGVAYNVAKLLSIFKKVNFFSLKLSQQLKKDVSNTNLKINEMNNKNTNSYYIALSDKKNKFLLGLANTDIYEKTISFKLPKIIEKKYLIFDLNFPKIFLQKIIKKLSKKNTIIVCATSIHKIHKIKNIIKNIDFLFLNKGELLKLTDSKNIYIAVKKIKNKNKNLTICATNGKNNVFFATNNKIYKIMPPKIKIKNENGAGDALAGMMIYLISENYSHNNILKYSIACGSYYASGKNIKNKNDFQKIKNLSKKVLIN